MVESMDPDEQLYEAAAKELASSPRTGLLAKCMAKSQGDENKAKARYLEVRVGEMKDFIREEAKRREEEARIKRVQKKNEKAKEDVNDPKYKVLQDEDDGMIPFLLAIAFIVVVIVCAAFMGAFG
jgi:predicted Holliday junction resolvase-like endonuclease